MREQLELLPNYLTAHLSLALVALTIGIVVSVPLGLLAARSARFEGPVLAVASVIQTVPSLALLAIMVPLLAAVGLTSIGYLPALIALTLYSILPILANTVTGIKSVDRALVEAARGVGMTTRQELSWVVLPLAMPVIVAGIRTSTVWVVAMATLSTPVGAPSLGNFIFSGLQTLNFDAVIVGCVSSAGLALLLDGLIRVLQVGVRDRNRRYTWVAGGAVAALYLYAGGSALVSAAWDEGTLKVGAKPFTEQYVLGEILSQTLGKATGQPVETMQSLGSSMVFDAVASDEIAAYVDYTGTIWTNLMKRPYDPKRRKEMLAEIREHLAERYGVHVVGKLGFDNAYCLAMKRSKAEALGIRRVSELAPHARTMTVGGDYEIFQRPEWKAIVSAYGLSFDEERSMDTALMYGAIAADSVDVVTAYTTDGRISALDLVVLEDDRHAIPPYDAIIIASGALFAEYPQAIRALEGLRGTIDNEAMRRLNAAVDDEKVNPKNVAAAFLAEH